VLSLFLKSALSKITICFYAKAAQNSFAGLKIVCKGESV